MFRLLWLSPVVKGELSILRTEKRNGKTYLLLPDNADTQAPGIQSLFWDSRKGHCVVEFSSASVEGSWFKVLETFGKEPRETKGAWLSGWLGEKPEHFGITEYDLVTLSDATKAVVTKTNSKKWVIHVHGRKTLIGETLRNFPLFENLGYRQMAISHWTDPKPFGLGKRRSTLGLTEWKLVGQAVQFAKENGATQVILFGWSLGGMICGQYLSRATDISLVKGVIFDSPMFDIRNTLRFQAGLAGYPAAFADDVCKLIEKSWILRTLGYPKIAVDQLSLSKQAITTDIPMLVLYSLNDGYIQISDAVDFAMKNSTVQLQEFKGARHCRLKNSDPELYDRTLTSFLERL